VNQQEARTVELTYHRAKVDPNPDLLGCLALLTALPLIGYGLIAFFSGHDQTAIFWYGLPGTLLVVASIFTPRLSRKSDAEFAQSFEAQVSQARSKDLRAEDVLNDLRSNPRPLWLFFRPFELENQLLAVSTNGSGVREAPNLIDYPEEGFANPKHQPVDLFDRLQSGFTSAASAAAVAVGRRPHPLHLDVGFVASTDADWRQHVEALAAAASVIVAMP